MNLTEQYDLSTLGPKSLDNDKIKIYANETLRKNKEITLIHSALEYYSVFDDINNVFADARKGTKHTEQDSNKIRQDALVRLRFSRA